MNSKSLATPSAFETLESRLFFSINPASAVAAEAKTSLAVQSAPSSAGGTGLTGQYFSGSSFTTPLAVTSNDNVNFDWVKGRPDQVVPFGVFGARWTGKIQATVTGTYTFYTNANAGTSLTVNGVSLFNTLGSTSNAQNSGTIALVAGQQYSLQLDYLSRGSGAAKVQLLYSAPGVKKQVIPASVLFPDTTVALPASNALTGTYYLGQNFAVPVLTRADKSINYTWNGTTPDQVIPSADTYSVRWLGTIVAPETGSYTFQTITDDGVRLYINGNLIINDFNDHPAKSDLGKITLTAGQSYPVRMDYYEDHIYANAVLSWKLPSGQRSPVPFTKPAVIPAAPVLSVGTSTTTSVGLSWTDVANETGFIVKRSTDGGTTFSQIGTTAAGVTTYTDSPLTIGTPYEYQVIAVDSYVQSVPSNVVSTGTVTAAPTTLTTAVQSPSQINLSWHDVAGENGFIIQKSADGSTGWTQIGTVGQGVTTFDAAGLNASTKYYFRVLAVDAGGDSAPSNVASATTSAPNPSYATLTTLYGLTGAGFVYSIDTTNGAATQIGTLSFGTNAAGRDPFTSNFYYISTGSSSVNISAWNPNDGSNTVIATNLALTGAVAEAAFATDGTFFITDDVGDIYAFNTDTNTATLKGNLHANGATLNTGNGDIAFAPDGTLYIETGSQLYSVPRGSIDVGTGGGSVITVTDIGSTASVGNLQLAFGQNGILFGTNAAGQLYSVNTATAATTPIGTPSGVDMGDLANVPLFSDLTVTQSAANLVRGKTGTYTFNVANAGPDTNVGAVTLVDTLPAGMSFVGGTGNGWTFNVNGQVVTMTYTANILENGVAAPAKLNVAVSAGVAASVTNTVTVSSSVYETNTANDSSSLTSSVG